MKFEKAKEILENEVANICDEELSEALEVVLSNSIPKKKVKDKIEKLDKKIENYREKTDFNMGTNEDYYANVENKAKKEILQELLEEDKQERQR